MIDDEPTPDEIKRGKLEAIVDDELSLLFGRISYWAGSQGMSNAETVDMLERIDQSDLAEQYENWAFVE